VNQHPILSGRWEQHVTRRRLRRWTTWLLVFTTLFPAGCLSHGQFRFREELAHYQTVATQIEYPDVNVGHASGVEETQEPFSVRRDEPAEYWPLTMDEAIRIALTNSEAIRDLGGRVVAAPATTVTVYDPAIAETDPLAGPQAALSAFDAQFGTGIFWNRNERTLNNVIFGGGTTSLAQNTAAFNAEINKHAATGTRFAVRSLVDYDRNNIPLADPILGTAGNRFASSYNAILEGEVRHPLLQGAGIEFNRIAGPYATPGRYNGVLLGRINTDITLADFEIGVRDLLSEVHRGYWDLYFAYRNLDARLAEREAALQTWRSERLKLEAGTTDREREALAREQYFAAQGAVQNALNGTGTGATVVSLTQGVYGNERRLRRLMGLPATDGRLIRPADNPSTADIVFDWNSSLADAMWRRPELRRQKWLIERRELELIAAENFLRMRLDVVGQYRWRGFGDDLFGSESIPQGSAVADLFTGDLQEWQMGLQLSTPIGNRIGHTAVRNAELHLARERAVHREQERHITHELSNALAELDRAYAVSRTNLNRTIAAKQQLDAVQAKYEVGEVLLEFVLDAQRRVTEAESEYYRSLTDHDVAIAAVHRARGTFLSYLGVQLTEGPWADAAYMSALKQSRRFRNKEMDYCFDVPCPVSAGPYPQVLSNGQDAPPVTPLPSPSEPSEPVAIPQPLP